MTTDTSGDLAFLHDSFYSVPELVEFITLGKSVAIVFNLILVSLQATKFLSASSR